MNKFGIVLGVAAVATLAGCKDPDYKHAGDEASQNQVKSMESTPAATVPAAVTPIESVPVVAKCNCLPGTKHTSPCMCGSPECKCIVVAKPISADLRKPPVTAPAATPAASTTYIVQRGDSLSKISKKYNITISSIRRANPKIKNDIVRIGQKITLPAKVDVGVQKVPEGAIAKPAKKVYSPFTGATKEYVVKNGDSLGAIAYGNGITIRQLKELNGLSKDSLRLGQKLKIPAEPKVGKAKKDAKKSVKEAKKDAANPEMKEAAKNDAAKEEKPQPAEAAKQPDAAASPAPAAEGTPAEDKPAAGDAAPADAAAAAPAAPATTTYVVQEGDDLTGVSIRWGVSTATIRELNNLSPDAQLVTGQILKLPAEAQQ